MLEKLLIVAAGGALGAMARYLVSGWVARLSHEAPFPWGTLVINVTGSLMLGLLMGAGSEGRLLVPPAWRVFIGVGILGAFTTFSTFSFETIEALRIGDTRVAVANVAANLLVGLPACWLGLQLGARL